MELHLINGGSLSLCFLVGISACHCTTFPLRSRPSLRSGLQLVGLDQGTSSSGKPASCSLSPRHPQLHAELPSPEQCRKSSWRTEASHQTTTTQSSAFRESGRCSKGWEKGHTTWNNSVSPLNHPTGTGRSEGDCRCPCGNSSIPGKDALSCKHPCREHSSP